MNFLAHVKRTFGFDYRTLAVYRCIMGIIIMTDVAYRIPDLVNFYTDMGLVPRSTFMAEMGMPWSFSLHFANGSLNFAIIMFSIHFLIGLLLMVGYKTPWAMFFAYLFTTSVHNRNWLVNNGGDDILRAILFISIFLPLNRCFSIDSALTKDKAPLKDQHYSTWGLMFFFQAFAIYYVSYLLKDHPMWRKDYTAVFYSSRLDIFATPLAVWMREFPLFLKASTIYAIWTEFLGPLILIGAFVFGRFWWVSRLVVIALFWGLHLGIIGTMLIGIFPWLCMGMWTIFIPGPFWDMCAAYFRGKNFGKLIIYFDGECRFCEKGVLILREFFLLPEVKIEKAQSVASINQDMLKHNSWVVVNENNERFYHFHAMLEVMKHSPILRYLVWPLSKSIFSVPLNGIYKWVASHRQLMSSYSQFLNFKPARKEIRWMRWPYQLGGALMLMTLIMWNVTTVKRWNVQAPFFQNIARWTHLYQEWNMFAPFPKMDNVWIEIPAILTDGSEIELLTGDRDVYSEKSQKFAKMVPNEHWRKFFLNLSERTDYARYYGGYLCREWNERGIRWVQDTTLRKFEIIVYSQMNLPDGKRGGITRAMSWKHWCFDEDFKKESVEKPGTL